MKTIGLMILLALLTGCVTVEYHRSDVAEDLVVKTLFKSLDGLYSSRDELGFEIIIDKTHTKNPLDGLTELLDAWGELQTMGLRYDPDWRSPLLPTEE